MRAAAAASSGSSLERFETLQTSSPRGEPAATMIFSAPTRMRLQAGLAPADGLVRPKASAASAAGTIDRADEVEPPRHELVHRAQYRRQQNDRGAALISGSIERTACCRPKSWSASRRAKACCGRQR